MQPQTPMGCKASGTVPSILGRGSAKREDVPSELKLCNMFYSRMALQHNPTPTIGHILRKLIGALRPGRHGLVPVVTCCVGYRFGLQITQPLHTEMHWFPRRGCSP